MAKKKEDSKEVVVVEAEEEKALVKRLEGSVPQIFNEAQRNLVLNETPRYKIKRRKGKGGMTFDYVDIGYVMEQLNLLTGHRWDFEIEWQIPLDEAKSVGQFIVRGALKLYSKEGDVVKKVNYGKCDIKKLVSDGSFLDLGNDMKGAASDCVKKCASMFGVALDVYSGSVKRRQDIEHPEATITEGQRRRLEALAGEAKIGHSGLKKLIAEMFDYTSTIEIQRQHFEQISQALEEKGISMKVEDEIPEDIKKGFDILGTPKAKRLATYRAFKDKNDLEGLRAKMNAKVDEKDAGKGETTTKGGKTTTKGNA